MSSNYSSNNRGRSRNGGGRRRSGGSRGSSARSGGGSRRRTVIYAGDGENDLCPALALKSGDSLLVRRGRGLERLLRERAAAKEEQEESAAAAAGKTPQRRSSSFFRQHPSLSRAFDPSLSSALAAGSRAFVWDTAEELRELVEALLLLCSE